MTSRNLCKNLFYWHFSSISGLFILQLVCIILVQVSFSLIRGVDLVFLDPSENLDPVTKTLNSIKQSLPDSSDYDEDYDPTHFWKKHFKSEHYFTFLELHAFCFRENISGPGYAPVSLVGGSKSYSSVASTKTDLRWMCAGTFKNSIFEWIIW